MLQQKGKGEGRLKTLKMQRWNKDTKVAQINLEPIKYKRRNKLYKKFRESGLEIGNDKFRATKTCFQKKNYFVEELAKNKSKLNKL